MLLKIKKIEPLANLKSSTGLTLVTTGDEIYFNLAFIGSIRLVAPMYGTAYESTSGDIGRVLHISFVSPMSGEKVGEILGFIPGFGGDIMTEIVTTFQASPSFVAPAEYTTPMIKTHKIDIYLSERTFKAAEGSVLSSDLHRDYIEWCKKNDFTAASSKVFGHVMLSAGFEQKRRYDGRYYLGLGLMTKLEEGTN